MGSDPLVNGFTQFGASIINMDKPPADYREFLKRNVVATRDWYANNKNPLGGGEFKQDEKTIKDFWVDKYYSRYMETIKRSHASELTVVDVIREFFRWLDDTLVNVESLEIITDNVMFDGNMLKTFSQGVDIQTRFMGNNYTRVLDTTSFFKGFTRKPHKFFVTKNQHGHYPSAKKEALKMKFPDGEWKKYHDCIVEKSHQPIEDSVLNAYFYCLLT